MQTKPSISTAFPFSSGLSEVERIPTQRASTRIARFEPLEQAGAMEQVLTGRAPLRRQLLLRVDDGVTDGAFSLGILVSIDCVYHEYRQDTHLSLQRSGDILPPSRQPIRD